MKLRTRVTFGLIISSLLLNVCSQNSFAASLPFEKVKWYWSDSKTTEQQRTFDERQYASSSDVPYIHVEARDPKFQLRSAYLERTQSGKWVPYGIGNPLSPDYDHNDFELMQGLLLIDPQCGVYTWCQGKVNFRLGIEGTVITEFSVNFVPKPSQLKVKLTSPAEVEWGKLFNLKVTVSPAASTKCTLVRATTQVGRATFSKGSGAFSVRALAYEKPEDGITKVNFLATCTQGSKVGKSEKTITVFVP